MAARPLLMKAYGGFSSLLYPLVSPLMSRRLKRGKEDPVRGDERRGMASLPRPDGLLVWLHGASVGEVISLLPIAQNLTSKGVTVLVTSGTVTSAEVAARRLPEGAIHQYIPLDLPAYVQRFLGHWKPDIGVFAESELWPNLVHAAHDAGTHLVIVNARMSERSFKRWKRFPKFITSMLSRFELVLAQTAADGDRLRELGAPRVMAIGNLKYDVTPPPAATAELETLKVAFAGRAVFVAASTHPGEEEQIAEAHRLAVQEVPSLLTVIAPRHPARGDEVSATIFRQGLSVCRRSEGVLPDMHTSVYVADTIGELGLFYRQSRIVYLGGSLVGHGGQNPIEPAKLGNAILHGPWVHNFTEVYQALEDSQGSERVTDATALAAALVRLLRNESELEIMAGNAMRKVSEMSGAVQSTIDALDPLLVQAHIERGG